MTTSIVDADSLLAIDVGTVTTRAILFDTVGGHYRFLATGAAPTTLAAPLNDVSEGVRRALEDLQTISGRALIDADERLVMPSGTDGSGVDAVVATLSAGGPLKVIAVGLLEDISLESARYLASTTYARVLETLSMNDRRKLEDRIDAIMALHPNLVIVAGGTENGASKSLLKLLEAVGLAGYLTPDKARPHVLFAGNQAVSKEVQATLQEYSVLHIAPNIRPALEDEQLAPAQGQLRQIFRQVHTRDNHAMQELDGWAAGRLMPSATAFGRVVGFLSRFYQSGKGVLGIDLGAGSTAVASAFSGALKLNVYPQLGMGPNLPSLLTYTSPANVARWLPFEVAEDHIRDYVFAKAAYPASLPATPEDLALEQALAREILITVMKAARKRFPARAAQTRPGLLPWFEPILASGSVLTKAPTRGQSLLMLLDALEPTGITTLVLDQNNLVPSLGAAAEVNAILAVQVIESGALLNLGTVISPVGNARPGTPVVRVKITHDSGEEQKLDIKQGSLETIPLPVGQAARLHVQPLHRYDVGMGGPGRGGSLRVVGGALGVVIDARGRPLQLSNVPARRQEMLKKWLWTLGG